MTPGQARRLRELAEIFQPQFLEILQGAGKANEQSLPWLLSSLASRDRYRSFLLDRCCKLLLVKEALDEGEQVFKTKDGALAGAIRGMCCDKQCSAQVYSKMRFLDTIRSTARPWVQFIFLFWKLFIRWRGRVQPEKHCEGLILLDIFVRPSLFDANGHFSDRYFAGWEKSLSPDEIGRVKYLPNLIDFKDEALGFQSLRASRSKFLIPDDYLNWADYIWIVWQMVKMAFLQLPDAKVAGTSIRSLMKEECILRFSDWSAMLGLLSYRFAQRSAEAGLRVDRLIDWSENQAVDRGLVLGFHRFHPETKVIAYKGYPLSKHGHPHLCPSQYEMKSGVHPKETWVIGEGNKRALQSTHSNIIVRIGPALRYESVLDDRPGKKDRLALLVCLSVELEECKEMLSLLKSATPYLPENLPVYIKPHPMLPRKNLATSNICNHENWEWKEEDFFELLCGARILWTSESSTAVEALGVGVPVLLLGRRGGITWHPVPDTIPPDAWALCFSTEEFLSSLEKLMVLSSNFMEEVSAQTKKEYFSLIRATNVRSLFGMAGAAKATSPGSEYRSRREECDI